MALKFPHNLRNTGIQLVGSFPFNKNHRLKFSEFSLVEWNGWDPEFEVTCSATPDMLGKTLFCLKIVDFLKLFAALEQYDCETISCTILYRNDDVILLAAITCFMRRKFNPCKWVLRSNYSSVFVGGVRKPFPDVLGNVSVIDTRNNAHWADSNWQFI